MTIEELDILLERYYKGQCNPAELRLVNTLLDRYAAGSPSELDEDQRREVLDRLQNEIELNIGEQLATPPLSTKGMAWKKSVILKWGLVAAAVSLAFGLFYFWQARQVEKQKVALSTNIVVRPGSTSASIVLPDGKTVALDSSLSSSIKSIQVSNSRLFLIKDNGQKVNLDRVAGLQVYSTLVTQRGQQAPEMRLADGTKVWLNAASSLRFPVTFNGSTRVVQLTGEAYFEVAKDAAHPFIVKAEGTEIKVLGTHFNVMAYKDEPATYATLLEGAIQLNNDKRSAKLKPGQQGVVNKAGEIVVKKVDAQVATAWMNGKLPMENMDVHAFLREVSRWYDVDIIYKTEIPKQTFSGNLNRKVPLTQILAALKANGVDCQLKNRTLIISKIF
jgi:ferric-dicitrate binding protein FerR (iron transport regulator)